MKALIVSPYLDHIGGGERYMLSVAEVLQKLAYETYFAWDNTEEINKLCGMLGITVTNPRLDPPVKQLYFSHNPLAMYQATKPYDVVVYLSDGSLPLLGGKRNIVHMQVPFHNVGGRSLKNQLKKRWIHAVIVNSEFTKRIIDREYNVQSAVIYPPVHIGGSLMPKENMILSVGRFEPSLNAKKQDVLIDAFKKIATSIQGWKLVLAGGSASEEWLSKLKKSAEGYPIEFFANAPFTTLSDLYASAKIYWHAAGFGVDEDKNPELVEHFGITTAEAIGNGCIPLVVPKGGQKEIVPDPTLQWNSVDELTVKTLELIKSGVPADKIATIDIAKYNIDEFAKAITGIVQS